VEGEAGTTGDFWLTLRTSFSAKEKAFASLPNESSARKTAKLREPAANEAPRPAVSVKPPQLLPARKAVGLRSDHAVSADWRN
jgi:hypothetical protein